MDLVHEVTLASCTANLTWTVYLGYHFKNEERHAMQVIG